jgi:hypothetical protein
MALKFEFELLLTLLPSPFPLLPDLLNIEILSKGVVVPIKNCDNQSDDLPIPGSQRHSHRMPVSGVSITQLLFLLFLFSFVNLALTHSERLLQLQFWDRLAITWENSISVLHMLLP